MLETEYIKSMNCNFLRTKLEEKPEERRYQYCIASRGGIWGLLPCSLRVINGDSFLYYDISSKQNLSQIFRKKSIDREWVKDFVWNLSKIRQELSRFLLDDGNLIWYPEHLYQDLEDNRWSFLYYPYYEDDNGFKQLLEFIVEKMDYSDDKLVECVYKIYEQYEKYGDSYLTEKINQDLEMLDNEKKKGSGKRSAKVEPNDEVLDEEKIEVIDKESYKYKDKDKDEETNRDGISTKLSVEEEISQIVNLEKSKEKKGLFSFLDSSRKKDKIIINENSEIKNSQGLDKRFTKNREAGKSIEDYPLYNKGTTKVAEEEFFDNERPAKEYGKTIYIPVVKEEKNLKKRLYDDNGKVLAVLNQESLLIGKKKDEVDVVIDDPSVSRIHARITYEDDEYYIEDLNSTNSTVKNGMPMLPYERRRLLPGDEIQLGNVEIHFE